MIWETDRKDTRYEQIYSEYQNLAKKYQQREYELSTVNASLVNYWNENQILKGIIAMTPAPKEDYWPELLSTRAALATITNELDLANKRVMRENAENAELLAEYNRLSDAVKEVNSRDDPTTTSNLTEEKRDNFYELWDLWYITLKEN